MYFGKKGEVVVLLVFAVVLAVGSLIFLIANGGSGITGAATIEPVAIGIQAVNSTSACGLLTVKGDIYRLIQNISSGATTGPSTCLTILNDSITVDCSGFKIVYGNDTTGPASTAVGISNSGGFDNITISNCLIEEGVGAASTATDLYGIYFKNVNNSIINATTIYAKHGFSHGIVLESSTSNVIQFVNISVSGTTAGPASGILINKSSLAGSFSFDNILNNINISITSTDVYSINDIIGATVGTSNSLIYNTSQGTINWTKANITSRINLSLGYTVFLEYNLLGLLLPSSILAGGNANDNLNSTAQIVFRNLSYQNKPDLLKAGVRCDDSTLGICNISYNATSGILFANITSFSNYSTQENDPPNVTIIAPINGTNFSLGLQDFNVTVSDAHSAVGVVIFQFTNGSIGDPPFNRTASNNSNNASIWNITGFNLSSLTEGTHNIKVFANDTLNNMNNTETINIVVDRTEPVVNLTSPSGGATLKGAQVFNATVTDATTQVNTVIFQFTNGSNPFNRTASNTSGTWNVSLDTNLLPEGSQIVKVFANDTVGNVNTPLATNDALKSFEIDNIPATIAGRASATATGTTAAATATTATTTATTAAATTATSTEAASAQQVSNAIQSGALAVSISSKAEAKPAAAPGVPGEAATGTISRSLTTVQTSEIKIVNHLDQKVRLAAELREEDFKIKNEDNVKKRIREELLRQGDASEEAVNRRLEELKLLEQVEVLQVYKTRLSSLLPKALTGAATASPLTPTKKQISARLLRDLLVNADELQNIEIDPGETLTAEIKFRRGLSLNPAKSTKLAFFSEGKEVLVEDLSKKEELVVGTAIDVDPETKQLDFYIFVPPQKEGGEEFFSAELDINVRKPIMKNIFIPLKTMLPLLFTERPKTIYGELYGPYKVNRQRGALLAAQYDASALEGEYEIVGRIYNEENILLAENHFEVQS